MTAAGFSPDTERLQQREKFDRRIFAALVVVLRVIFDLAGLWAVLNWRRRGILVLQQFGTRRYFHLMSS
jgi:hypothetical protein